MWKRHESLEARRPTVRMSKSPRDVHILIQGNCVYLTLHAKRDFKDVIKLRIFIWEVILDYPAGTCVTRSILIRRKQKGQTEKQM